MRRPKKIATKTKMFLEPQKILILVINIMSETCLQKVYFWRMSLSRFPEAGPLWATVLLAQKLCTIPLGARAYPDGMVHRNFLIKLRGCRNGHSDRSVHREDLEHSSVSYMIMTSPINYNSFIC